VTAAAPIVSTLVAPAERRALMGRVEMRFAASMGIANMIGAAVVFLFLGLLLPRSQRENGLNVGALLAYMFLSMLVGCAWSTRVFKPMHDWVVDGRPTNPDLREYVVRHPLRQSVVNFALWMGSEVVFIPINSRYGAQTAFDVASTILLGAITTCGLAYLLAERILRPVCELAFSDGLPAHAYVPGVKSRLLLSWALGSAVPLVGVVLMALDHGSKPISPSALAFLGIVALLAGATTMVFSAKSVAEPVESVTAALADVEAGRLDIAVPVYDGSQVGQLQAGFNAMVDGLRERRRLRDLFGRQVGEDVAQHALQRGVHLGGEQMHVAVLFVDVIGSTALAQSLPPTAVVAALNEFFAIVVDVVDRTGGIINKFEGDAALCVFGAPVPREDAAACALLAARLLRERLADVNGLSAAIGVSAGLVVAGNVGTKERFEYTVIGDAVNEAARLTELAKTRPERLLVSALVLESLDDEAELARWQLDGETTLRGRSAPTALAVAR
jgi:adenylate cyclase